MPLFLYFRCMYLSRTFRSITLTCIAFSLLSTSLHAIEYGGFGGRPAYPRADNDRTESIFIHTLEPGSEKAE